MALGSNAAEASAWARKLRVAYPDDPAPLVLLGVLAERGGETAGAAEFYRAALEIDPSDPDARRGLDRLSQHR